MLIKNIKTTQANLLTAHDTLSSSSNVGLIVCEDTNKMYIQGDDFSQPPLNISTTDNWKFTSTLGEESIDEVVTVDTPLTFRALSSTNAICLSTVGDVGGEIYPIILQYRKNNGSWTEYNTDDIIPLSRGDIIAFSGNNDHFSNTNDHYQFIITGATKVYGNAMSLTNFDMVSTSACYHALFQDCSGLLDASKLLLPNIVIEAGCYEGMFQGCTSLTAAPLLPATTLAEHCYWLMFDGCTSLSTAPTLPATTLATNCYRDMFYGCTSLNSIEVAFTEWERIDSWVSNVAADGTFYCPELLDTTIRDSDHIPLGWTVSHEARVLSNNENNNSESNNSNSNSDSANFLVNQKYIRDDNKSTFVLPTEEYAQVSGDTIEFYNATSSNFAIKQGETTIVENEDGTSGQYFKFYWDGTNWNQITIGSSSETGGGTGTLSAVLINDILYSNTEEDGIAHLGSGYIQIDSEPTIGEYLKYTEDGWTTQELAKLSCSYTSEDVSNNILSVSGDYLPIMIRTNKNTLYPIEKGTMTLLNGLFKIKLLPYLSYDNSAEFTGTWVVYFGSGINDVYTTANTVVSGSITDALPYSLDFETGDVQVINVTATGTVTLLVTNLAVGHGMVIKVINNNGASIQFAGRTLIDEAGTYSFSVFSFEEGKVEQIGEVTRVYAAQVLTP